MRILCALLLSMFIAAPAVSKVAELADDARATAPGFVRAASTTGSVGPMTYDRIFTSDVSNSCMATSSFSGSGVGVPYKLVPFYTTSATPEPLEVSINAAGTDIGDTVLSIYCAFNANDASTGLVAYDDDGGGGLLSAITAADGVIIQPGTTYFAVVSVFAPGSVGGGNFQLDFGGQLTTGFFTTPPLSIPASSFNSNLLLLGVLLLASLLVLRKRIG